MIEITSLPFAIVLALSLIRYTHWSGTSTINKGNTLIKTYMYLYVTTAGCDKDEILFHLFKNYIKLFITFIEIKCPLHKIP